MQEHFERFFEQHKSTLITHDDCINMMQWMGYPANEDGVCYGLAMMAIQAHLSGGIELAWFNKRLALIPVLDFLIKDALLQEWNEICANPLYITSKNIYFSKQKLLHDYYPDDPTKSEESFSTLLASLPQEEQDKITEIAIEQAIFEKLVKTKSNKIARRIWESVAETDEKITAGTLETLRDNIRNKIADIENSTTPSTLAAFQELQQSSDADLARLIREIPTFFEGVEAYANSENADYQHFVAAASAFKFFKATEQQAWPIMQKLYSPDGLRDEKHNAKMQVCYSRDDAFTCYQLASFFQKYLEFSLTGKSAFAVHGHGHRIAVGYNEDTQQWWLLDANNMPLKTYETAAELAESIFSCFRFTNGIFDINHKECVTLGIDLIIADQHLSQNKELIALKRKLLATKSREILHQRGSESTPLQTTELSNAEYDASIDAIRNVITLWDPNRTQEESTSLRPN